MSIEPSPSDTEIPTVVAWLLQRAERIATQQDLTAAQRLFEAAIACDPTPVARIAFAVELAREDLPGAIAQFEIAWDDARRVNNAQLRAICCRNLAILFRVTGNAPLAHQFRQLAISAEMDGPPSSNASMISPSLSSEIAWGWFTTGDIDSALRLLASAGELARQRDATEQVSIESHLAIIALMGSRPIAAQNHLIQAIRHCRDEGDWWGCGLMLVNLGHVLQVIQRHAEAYRCFRAGTEILLLVGNARLAEAALAYQIEAANRDRLDHTKPECN